MGYISVVCTNPDCALETTRLEDTEYCPKCDGYTQPIAGLTSQAAPVAPMVNKNISPALLRSIAESKPLDFDSRDIVFIYKLLEKKHLELFTAAFELEQGGDDRSANYFKLCSETDHAMKIMNIIAADLKRNRAKVEIHRRMTGFYSKPENVSADYNDKNIVSIA